MPRRPVERRSRVREDISPESHITMSLQQILMIAVILLTAGSGYAYLVWGQSAANTAITEINSKITTVSSTDAKSIADQDAKREKMGQDFLASTEKIADKVSELNTALAVQQTTSKQMSDTLVTISNQLGAVLQHTDSTTAGHK